MVKTTPRTFTDKNEHVLIVVHGKALIRFDTTLTSRNVNKQGETDKTYPIDSETRQDFIAFMNQTARTSWTNVIPRDATSDASDYWHKYDKKTDNDSFLYLNDSGLRVIGPYGADTEMYTFTKRKLETFLFDLAKQRKGDT